MLLLTCGESGPEPSEVESKYCPPGYALLCLGDCDGLNPKSMVRELSVDDLLVVVVDAGFVH